MQYQCYDVVKWLDDDFYQLYGRGKLYYFGRKEVLANGRNGFWSDEDFYRVKELITPKEYA